MASIHPISSICSFAFFKHFPSVSYNHNLHKFPVAGITYSNFETSEVRQKINKETSSGNSTEKSRNYCEVIHIGIVCSGYESNLYLHTLLKSIYFYRNNPIYFHIIASRVSRKVLGTLFETWNVPQVNVTFYDVNDLIPDVRWVPNSHYSGNYGLLKLVFPKIIDLNLTKKILILDIDLTVVSNIYDLWKLFDEFNKTQAIGIVDNQSKYYINSFRAWPAIGQGFNTGVLLYHLERLKNLKWPVVWAGIAKSVISTHGSVRLGDQDIMNAVLKQHPYLLYKVPCYWNTQLSDYTLSYDCYKVNQPKIVHWNSPKKHNVINKDGDYFRNLRTSFVEYNGNLLRKSLQLCEVSAYQKKTAEEVCLKSCKDFCKTNKWRTFLYFREYKSISEVYDVTYVTQLSYDRLQSIEELVKLWPGPISFTLYVSDPELEKCITFIKQSEILKDRLNVAYHAVFKDGEYYPINTLRNVGLRNVNTPYVFLADIDFLPMKNLYSTLQTYLAAMKDMKKIALIVPAFEIQKYDTKIPRTKGQLISMWQKKVRPFLSNVWAPGHAPTDFEKWKNAVDPYKVKWQPDFEPYVVVSSKVVPYDERFMGFGWNKVSHIMELEAQDYKFIVLPDSFIVHKPHAPSYDIDRFRTSATYRMCLQILKQEFIQKLNRQYGRQFKYLNSSIIFETNRKKRNFIAVNTTEETNTDYPYIME